jgi:phosphoglycolate phosphatase
MKLVLFDCDGTLVDSGGLIHEVMARTFADFKMTPPTPAATRSIIGLTLDIAIAHLRGEQHATDVDFAMTAHYKAIYGSVRAEPGFQEPVYEGIQSMLAHLTLREDYILGAVTGKSRRGLTLICETHGFSQTFRVSRTSDDCPSKPHPAMVTECCEATGIDPVDTIVIGDAIYDMQMARAAGAKALGVSWGYGQSADLWTHGAHAVADHPSEIPDLIVKSFADA